MNDYYPGGMILPNRNGSSDSYRYGFNNMEKDDELKGEGNSYDFGARMYDPRIGRWFATDPLEKKYASTSPYVYTGDNPILFVDYDGNDFGIKINHKTKTIIIVANIYTVSDKTYSQAQKAIKQWNNLKDIKVEGYSVKFDLTAKPPSDPTDADVIAHFKPTDENPIANEIYNSLFKKNGKKKANAFKQKKNMLKSIDKKFKVDNDDIGNSYEGLGLKAKKVKGGVGGISDHNSSKMFKHEELGDLGGYSDLVAHEIGHLLGLSDEGGAFFTELGIMKYAKSGANLNDPHREDVKLILDYSKGVLDGTIKTGAGTGNPTVKLIENVGESDGSNPIGVKTEKNED